MFFIFDIIFKGSYSWLNLLKRVYSVKLNIL